MKNIKKMVLVSAFAGTCLTPHAQTASPVIPTDPAIETHIREWLQKMTLEQKIGQMCEITIDVVSDLETSRKKGFCLSEAMLDTVIGKYKVGSLLNVPLGVAQKKEKWAEAIKQIQEKSMKEIGIPCIYGVDQIHGTTYTLDGTMFPQGINMGATFNRELTRRGAKISAYETKAGCIPWTFAPVVDLGRDPRWARMWENYGEDCYVNAEMGVSAVKGFQGEDPNRIGEYNVAACMKHYMGYGVPVSGKDRTPSSISRSDMREKHFAPFLAAVRQGALSVMVNSGVDNGLPFHANRELLTEWLKEVLVGGIMDHLSGMFDAVNQQVGDVATQVGTSPANFSPGVFSMIRNVSESVIIPIAGIILTIIACYELIQMIIDHNNLANFETWIFFKWVFKTFVAVMLITNCFNITMAVFDVCQNVINGAGGLISDTTAVDGAALDTLEETLMEMDIGPLIGLFLQSFLLNVTMWALSIIIFIIVYGRMIEIYLAVSLAPIPFATFGNREQSQVGQNYLRSLLALGFQGFLILICVGIYAVLIQGISFSDDVIASIWGVVGYTVLLCFTLFKTGALAKGVFSAH